ncbi:uncharacterized protein LOC111369022 [Olea europaea var. sylvestris]|uniref:uncharacterized protein LOC111369022 n=1 Tax=Olea europaea var. sylvestris TaxID=158386 RepID=UPI000C1CF09D|nr:uncharacterized protein LOC111369022 [Olea europaea var. sylvestris]
MIDVSTGGSVMKLDVDEAYDLYERVAENQSTWPTDGETPRKTTGLHNVDAVTALAAQMEVLTMKMDNLSQSVNMVHQSPPVCEGCGADHNTTHFPLASTHVNQSEEVNYAQNFQRQQNNPFSNTFNPGWRNHPNFSWSSNQGQGQGGLNQELGTTGGIDCSRIISRAQRTLPSNTETNPKEQVKAITIRSGVQLPEIHVKRPVTITEKAPTTGEEQVDKLDKTTEENQIESSGSPRVKTSTPVKAYVPPISFPQKLQKHKLDKQFQKFLDVFKKLHINISFAEALAQMPNYAKFMKDILSNKRKLEDNETVMLTEECSAIFQHKLPPKLNDPGNKALCDLGASINLMPLSLFKKLGLGEAKATTISLQLADRSIKHPRGICEDILVKVDKFIFPVDFIILDMEKDRDVPLILGRPFLATGRALIDVQKDQLILRLDEEGLTINVFRAFKFQNELDSCMQIDIIREAVLEAFKLDHPQDPLEAFLVHYQESPSKKEEAEDCAHYLVAIPPLFKRPCLELGERPTKPLPFILQAPTLELKQLPIHLRYAYLGQKNSLLIIISNNLTELEEDQPLRVLREHKTALGWTISDIKGISHLLCMHKILMEDDSVEHQRRLNPNMQEVVRKEVSKLLDARIIYPISDSHWVSPVQVVPKKGGITVVPNENNELIPTWTVTGWRVCIDYRKLNNATRKDYFLLPFIDQMLEKLAGHAYYCFLDGYSRYNQISIAPDNQEKITFTCPYDTFAYRRMLFGLCNAPATFQRCMMSIFSDMVGHIIEVFMNDFSVFEKSFKECLEHLGKLLQRCEGANLEKNSHVIHYASKTLDEAQMNYATTKKELLAVVFAVDKFRSYLIGLKVIVYTDHSVLKYLLSKKDAKPRLIRWILLLQEFDLEIRDKKESENVVVDHLSRFESHKSNPTVEINEVFPDEMLF